MRNRWLWTMTLALTALTGGLAAQDTRPGLAILPFEDGGSYGQDKENFEALKRGIPAMLASELSNNPNVRLVDREQIQRLLEEQNLGKEGRVDAATAAKIGKLVGARYMIAGTFTDFYGRFRVDARIINVETSEIIKTVRSDPKLEKREELFRSIQSLAEKLMAETKLPPLPVEVSQRVKARNVPTEALTYYSRALLYQDRGDNAKAAEYFRKALDVFPEYAEAGEGLKRIESKS
ncbi:MAG TPA: CsgG/HfaB family protein [Gemmatimonadales bacterium]|jgi:TolB-like protein|nr:CsgG/HfaB family protein [Gemmatimonadales bacterium]